MEMLQAHIAVWKNFSDIMQRNYLAELHSNNDRPDLKQLKCSFKKWW